MGGNEKKIAIITCRLQRAWSDFPLWIAPLQGHEEPDTSRRGVPPKSWYLPLAWNFHLVQHLVPADWEHWVQWWYSCHSFCDSQSQSHLISTECVVSFTTRKGPLSPESMSYQTKGEHVHGSFFCLLIWQWLREKNLKSRCHIESVLLWYVTLWTFCVTLPGWTNTTILFFCDSLQSWESCLGDDTRLYSFIWENYYIN